MEIQYHQSVIFTGLRLEKKDKGMTYVQEQYTPGLELNPSFLFDQWKTIACRLGIEPRLYFSPCSDEVNVEHFKVRLSSFGSGFVNALIGTQVCAQSTEVALKPGHDSQIIEINTHLGVYRPEGSNCVYAGKIRGRDMTYRDACGALGHVLEDLLHNHEPEHLILYDESGKKVDVWRVIKDNKDYNFLGGLYEDLFPHKEQIVAAYNSAEGNHKEKFAWAMRYLSFKNMEVQLQKAIRMVLDYHKKGGCAKNRLVFGTVSLNRIKYSDTMVMKAAYLLTKDNEVMELSKTTF